MVYINKRFTKHIIEESRNFEYKRWAAKKIEEMNSIPNNKPHIMFFQVLYNFTTVTN